MLRHFTSCRDYPYLPTSLGTHVQDQEYSHGTKRLPYREYSELSALTTGICKCCTNPLLFWVLSVAAVLSLRAARRTGFGQILCKGLILACEHGWESAMPQGMEGSTWQSTPSRRHQLAWSLRKHTYVACVCVCMSVYLTPLGAHPGHLGPHSL